MNTAKYFYDLIDRMKAEGRPLQETLWTAAKACEGWAYVYGAWGAECTPAERRKRLRYHPEKTEISKKCQVLNGSSKSCPGCKWYPDNERTLCFDCRGFTDKLLNVVYGFDLYGDAVGTQWRASQNWKAKGTIDSMPKDTLCCLFVYKDGKYTHTGFGLNDDTIECSSGVQVKKRDKRWTHWAVPACVEIAPQPDPGPMPEKRPTLRKGDAGPYVTLAQMELIQRGYDLGSWGADGKFGSKTEEAVKAFQRDWGLTVDGVIGPKTWTMLDSTPVLVRYTVTIPHMSLGDAEALVKLYPEATMKKEGGE